MILTTYMSDCVALEDLLVMDFGLVYLYVSYYSHYCMFVKTHEEILAVCGPQFTKFRGNVGDTS